ncbi:ribonuclease H-like domain-containing protein, partial [Tanacetum coccineum]
EYDIWAMKMEHYLGHIDYPIWEVIQKGNGPVQVSIDTNGQIMVLPPKTAEEILARERERKARTTLLMSIPEDHLAKFHRMTDAKKIWEAIKSRFGGNDESKKMQKYNLKQQFKSFFVSNLEGLYKGYDMFQNILSQLEIHGAGVSTEDANQKFLRFSWVFFLRTKDETSGILKDFIRQIENQLNKKVKTIRSDNGAEFKNRDMIEFCGSKGIKREYSNARTPQQNRVAERKNETLIEAARTMLADSFLPNTFWAEASLNTEVTSCSKECEESYAKLKKLYDEQREQLGVASIEIQAYTQALKKVEAQLKLLAEAVKEKEELKTKLENFQSSSKGLSKLLNSQMSTRDKSGLGYGNQIHEGVLSYEKEVLESVFDSRSSDVEDSPVNDRFAKVEGMHAIPPSMTGIYMPSKSDFGIDESKFTYGPK